MKALVTGGTGFIGTNIALHLVENKHDVYITGAPMSKRFRLRRKSDLLQLKTLKQATNNLM